MKMGQLTRRDLLRALGIIGSTSVAVSLGLGGFMKVAAQQTQPGMPQPDEKVDATIKRLFGNRSISPAAGKVKLEAPLIAENGSVVPVTVEADLPMTPQKYVKSIYIISDKNRRPLIRQKPPSSECQVLPYSRGWEGSHFYQHPAGGDHRSQGDRRNERWSAVHG